MVKMRSKKNLVITASHVAEVVMYTMFGRLEKMQNKPSGDVHFVETNIQIRIEPIIGNVLKNFPIDFGGRHQFRAMSQPDNPDFPSATEVTQLNI